MSEIISVLSSRCDLWNDLLLAWLVAGAHQVAPERMYLVAGYLAVAGVMFGALAAQRFRKSLVSAAALAPAALGVGLGSVVLVGYAALLAR